jgi:hypothetical protein
MKTGQNPLVLSLSRNESRSASHAWFDRLAMSGGVALSTLLLLLLLSGRDAAHGAALASDNAVTFSLMAPAARTVVVRGSWNQMGQPVTCVKGADGRWTGSARLSAGTYNYIFVVNDVEWMIDPDNADLVDDGMGGFLSVVKAGAAAGAATPATPAATPAPAPVAPSNGAVFSVPAPGAGKVEVLGSWDGWSTPTACTLGADGKWTASINLAPGTYEYKFRQDGDWEKLNVDNRKVTIGADGRAVADAAAAPAASPAPAVAAPARGDGVAFSIEAAGVRLVEVMGSWNGWSAPTVCTLGADGKWTATIKLAPGTYDYKFRADGDWDKLNTDNRKITVGADGRAVEAGAQSTAAAASGATTVGAVAVPPGVDFTQTMAVMSADGQQVIFGYADPFAGKVQVGGEFNSWTPDKLPLTKNADGVWVGAITVKEGRYKWKFVVDGQWESGDDHRLTIIRNKSGALEILPDAPTFNTPYNSRIYFSGRFYGQAVLRNVPDGENADTGRTRFAPMEYNMMPRMIFTAGDKVTGMMEVDINQTEGRFQTNFSSGWVEMREPFGTLSLFRRHRITEFNDPLRSLDRFRDTLDDEIYFTNEERPASHRFGRKFDQVRRFTNDAGNNYTYRGWQGLVGELNLGRWKFQALGADNVIGAEDLWGARATWQSKWVRVGTSYVRHSVARGLTAERGYAGGDIRQTSPFTDTTGGHVVYPGTNDHYSYDALTVFEPNGPNREHWWSGDVRVGSDTRNLFVQLQGRDKDWSFVASENGDGLRPNGSANFSGADNYLNAGEYLLGGREDELTAYFGAVFFPTPRLGLELSDRIDDGTALTLNANRQLVSLQPSANTVTGRGRYLGEKFQYGIEISRRTVTDFPNGYVQADFDNYDFADVRVAGASDLLQFKQDLSFKLGRWFMDGGHRFRRYNVLAGTLESNELRGHLGYQLSPRLSLVLSGRMKAYSPPNITALTNQPNRPQRFYSWGFRALYNLTKHVRINFGYGVNFENDEDVEEGQLFFLRDALARSRRGPAAYGGPVISHTLDQVINAERILSNEQRLELNVDARF